MQPVFQEAPKEGFVCRPRHHNGDYDSDVDDDDGGDYDDMVMMVRVTVMEIMRQTIQCPFDDDNINQNHIKGRVSLNFFILS